MEFTEAAYEPRVVEHIPGVAHVVADALSRRYDPNKTWVLPPLLQDIPETEVPIRDEDYYVTWATYRTHLCAKQVQEFGHKSEILSWGCTR